jgi:hypothetical protein
MRSEGFSEYLIATVARRRMTLGVRVTCSAMKFAFADTRIRYIELMAATARCLIQT